MFFSIYFPKVLAIVLRPFFYLCKILYISIRDVNMDIVFTLALA